MRGYPDLVGGRLLRAAVRGAAVRGAAAVPGPVGARAIPPPPTVSASAATSPTFSTAPGSPPPSLSASFSDAGAGRGPLSSSFVSEGGGWDAEEDGDGEERGVWYGERVVFGPAPSGEEVAEAVSTLQQIFIPFRFSQNVDDGFSSTSDTNALNEAQFSTDSTSGFSSAALQPEWIEPTLLFHKPKNARSQGQDRLMNAFQSLQTNPSIQRMVVSLSSDKAVWDAVMRNDAVKELRESFYPDDAPENGESAKSDEGLNVAAQAVCRILENAKVKIIELIERITKLLNQLLHPHEKSKMDDFEDAVRSSFTVSVVVIVIVVIFRIHRS